MKKIPDKSRRGEKGMAMVITLMLLFLGGVMIAPLLSYTGTGLLIGKEVDEKRMTELYAADSGIEDGIWKIMNEQIPATQPYPLVVNDKPVNVSMVLVDSTDEADTYEITSVATSDDGSTTTIVSYVEFMPIDISFLGDNGITSPGDVTLKPGTEVNGDVQYNGELDYDPDKSDINGDITDETITDWPDADYLAGIYQDDVSAAFSVPDGYEIDVDGYTEDNPYLIPPLYGEGSMEINGSGVAQLDGTIYIAGDSSNFNVMPGVTLIMNNQAIFSEGDINFQPNCSSIGSGAIIAVGDINYQPNILGDDYVFIMSVEGNVHMQPNGVFAGAIAGDSVDLWPGTVLQYKDPDDGDINFPFGGLHVKTWEINVQ